MKIYTIGYQALTVAALLEIMAGIDLLIDVRSIPYSRKPEFNKNRLMEALGEKYLWMGKECGGKTGVTLECYKQLQKLGKKSVLLMCMEADPAQCHRSEVAAKFAKLSGGKVIHHITELPA